LQHRAAPRVHPDDEPTTAMVGVIPLAGFSWSQVFPSLGCADLGRPGQQQ
jgi:hypothetical protein